MFLDRDGTLNVEKDYLFRFEDWTYLPGVVGALKELSDLGFLLVVVSNQSGVGRGYYTEADVEKLHQRVKDDLGSHGVSVAGFYFCPHGPTEGCLCRKPEPGLLLRALKDFDIDPNASFMVGDKATDVEAGRRAGATSLLVRTGYGDKEKELVAPSVPVVKDLVGAVAWINKCISRWG